MKGFPDIAGLFNGRFFAIEVKRPDGRMSPEQEVWRGRLEAKGCLYVVATSVADVDSAFRLMPEVLIK
jgi:hypothetical protein